MPKVNLSVPFQIPQDEALRRIQARIQEIKAQYGTTVSDLRESWAGYVGSFSGTARGVSVSGTIIVDPSQVTVLIPLPFIAFPIRGQIETTIANELTKLLA